MTLPLEWDATDRVISMMPPISWCPGPLRFIDDEFCDLSKDKHQMAVRIGGNGKAIARCLLVVVSTALRSKLAGLPHNNNATSPGIHDRS